MKSGQTLTKPYDRAVTNPLVHKPGGWAVHRHDTFTLPGPDTKPAQIRGNNGDCSAAANVV